MTLRAGEGIVINYDGAGAEVAVSTPQWFVAEITGTVLGSSPVIHKWKKKVPKKDGKTYEDANPPLIGDGTSNPAYLPALTTGTTSTATVSGLVYMRLRGQNGAGQAVYEIIGAAGGSGGGGGNATLEVVTDVTCTPSGLEVSTATLAGADYDVAIIRQFLSLSDVVPKSFLGNQGRVVRVNEAATGLEFGPTTGSLAQTFIALDDTPLIYGSSAYKSVIVNSTNDGVTFAANNITVEKSLSGGGNPNITTGGSAWQPLSLLNDVANPGNNQHYGTNSTGEKGWYTNPDISGLDTRLDTLEGQTLDTRLTTIEGQTLDTRLTTIEGQTLDTRLTTIEGQTLDTRLTTIEGQTLDTRLTTIEGQTLDTRLTTLEGQTLDTRLTTIEGQTLDTRLTTLEGYISSSALTFGGIQVVGAQQGAVADAVGGTIDNTDVASCASTTQTAVDDLKTQINYLLAALRTHGLIAS
jgi:hypothetical protein